MENWSGERNDMNKHCIESVYIYIANIFLEIRQQIAQDLHFTVVFVILIKKA